MRKILILAGIIATVFIFTNCNPSKKATASTAPKSTYEANVSSVIMSKCTPCHIPVKGGNKKAYDNYANVKTDIDEIIRRIELNPGEKGFMPFKHPKLSADTIAIFKQWKTDGAIEK